MIFNGSETMWIHDFLKIILQWSISLNVIGEKYSSGHVIIHVRDQMFWFNNNRYLRPILSF